MTMNFTSLVKDQIKYWSAFKEGLLTICKYVNAKLYPSELKTPLTVNFDEDLQSYETYEEGLEIMFWNGDAILNKGCLKISIWRYANDAELWFPQSETMAEAVYKTAEKINKGEEIKLLLNEFARPK